MNTFSTDKQFHSALHCRRYIEWKCVSPNNIRLFSIIITNAISRAEAVATENVRKFNPSSHKQIVVDRIQLYQ